MDARCVGLKTGISSALKTIERSVLHFLVSVDRTMVYPISLTNIPS